MILRQAFSPVRRMSHFGVCLAIALTGSSPAMAIGQENRISLEGEWMVTSDDQAIPKPVEVPSSLEDAWQVEYDGKSVWRKTIPGIDVAEDQRLILHFQAVATKATVWIDDQLVGHHLGGWTPFEFDITEFVTANADKKSWELKVEVDELVGHNTQGFLPIITHHFGGIWQPVWLEVVPATRIDSSAVLDRGDPFANSVHFSVPIIGPSNGKSETLRVSWRPWQGEPAGEWDILGDLPRKNLDGAAAALAFEGQFEIPNAIGWSPANPQLYEARFDLMETDSDGAGSHLDSATVRFGFASCTNEDKSLLWNGKPLIVRGVLNWGYALPRIAPSLDEESMRNEIRFAQERGFNLMKFCLWIPPKRYLELCDEMGMLAWVEYPTWHPQLDKQHRAGLFREYEEFFRFDRNHPSVALRSLTCETGPSADIEVIRELYDLGKSMIPGAMIEDDSSWIEWNRVHDFYDDHPYGNNHTWVDTLARLNQYIEGRKQLPLVLGEAIAADTWTMNNPFAKASPMRKSAHEPWSFEAGKIWVAARVAQAKSKGRVVSEERLYRDSLRYAMAMRKFQIETYRREVPHGGYVVSVIRDFPKASMGLIDFSGVQKTAPDDWNFQGDVSILLESNNDCRSFESGKQHEIRFLFAGLSSEPGHELTSFSWKLVDRSGLELGQAESGLADLVFDKESGHLCSSVHLAGPKTTGPLPATIQCELIFDGKTVKNEWPIWVCPPVDISSLCLVATKSFREKHADKLFENIPDFVPGKVGKAVVLTSSIDMDILDVLDQRGVVLMLPGKTEGSFRLEDHWFLRGGPALFRRNPEYKWSPEETSGTEMLIELQHLDLAGPVIPRIDSWIERIDPVLLLWDNHDLREFRTHGLMFSMEVGSGALTVSTLNYEGESNAAGRWLLGQLLHTLAGSFRNGDLVTSRSHENMKLLRQDLQKRQLDLTKQNWVFRPDRNDLGHDQKWFLEKPAKNDWNQIRIGAHWESQGYADLDGWAWYRTTIRVPNDWPKQAGYLNFTGADDFCEVYVNGELVGSCGDLERRETAFDLASSINIGKRMIAGQEIELVIAVNDWNGAGGLFRPILLATEIGDSQTEMLIPLASAPGN